MQIYFWRLELCHLLLHDSKLLLWQQFAVPVIITRCALALLLAQFS